MFDLTKSAEQEALEKVRDFTTKNYGRVSYILAMREESGELKLHHRANQPCYGELRKYFATHEDQYTDPEPHDEYRPGDLHDPFPEGTPEGLGLNFNNWDTIFSQEGSVVKELIPVRDRLIRYAFSENSPWRRGIVPGTIEFVEAPVVIKASFPDHIKKNSYTAFGKDKFETNAIAGIIMRDLSVDPTVSVNLFNNIKWVFSTESAMGFAKMLFDQGASDLEVLGLLQIAIIHRIWSEESELRASDYRNYYHPSFLDWRRFSTGDPHNLTGGLLKDRYDYNRKRLHEVFSVELFDYNRFEDEEDADFYQEFNSASSFVVMREIAKEKGLSLKKNVLEVFRLMCDAENTKQANVG